MDHFDYFQGRYISQENQSEVIPWREIKYLNPSHEQEEKHCSEAVQD